uniref:CD276 antigen-like n=1 Tax=Poecilia formosa TaxID=48698 RepID=A0A096M0E8_POEFO
VFYCVDSTNHQQEILQRTIICMFYPPNPLLWLQCALPTINVTSSGQPVVAAPGDDVILQCLVEPQLDMVDMTVEWSRPDAKRRPKGMEYVHLYRDNREVEDMKSSSYHNRTALFAGGLRHGNISLIVTNVTTADEGEYKCFIPK